MFLANDELLFHVDSCGEGHSIKKIEKMIVWSSSNALLNNFYSKENDDITCKKLSKKRKLQAFNWILRHKKTFICLVFKNSNLNLFTLN